MLNQLTTDDTTTVLAAVATATVGHKGGFLSLAGDALCLAMTALRLTDASTPSAPQLQQTLNAPHKVISLDQVSWHDHISDCWVVVYDGVYNITNFLIEHPGGEEILLEYAGRDATLAFRGIGHGMAMIRALEPYLVGVLPDSERIFQSPGDKLAGLML